MKLSLRTFYSLALCSLVLSACASQVNSSFDDQFRPPQISSAAVTEEVMGKWSRSCALCHITGEAGAPVVGDTAEWQRRLQQGEQVILTNVLEGFNSMPPLGYCMSCEVSDFRAMIIYMAGLDQ